MTSKKTDKIYKLPYDSELDKDIQDFLDSIPRNRRADVVRFGLRYYMRNIIDGQPFKVRENGVPADEVEELLVEKEEIEVEKKEPSSLLFSMNNTD
ncbi:hypothetical protein [Peribacillus asahii]|uniref:hypothetical protein n=1 Tax=Peribacillus asahii TaxID=228899 RepID=UPI00382EA51B